MNTRYVFVFAALLLTAAFVMAGCVAAPPTAPIAERQQAAADAATAAQPSAPPAETTPSQPEAVEEIPTLPKEEAAQPAASVVLKSPPKIAAAGIEFTVSWSITGEPGTTQHTAVHYGRQSVPDPKAPSDYSLTSHIFCTSTPCKVPNSFQTPIKIQEDGIYYYRAHTIINGNHYWSEEASINVSSAPEVVTMFARPSGGGGY